MHHLFRRIASSIVIAVAVFGMHASNLLAQQATAATDPEATPITTVVVTGSRIPVAANITSSSPIQVVTSQDIALQGTTDTTNIINRLPQNIIGAAVDLGNNSAPLSAAGA
jgi:iron complex outermembrane receptor protein